MPTKERRENDKKRREHEKEQAEEKARWDSTRPAYAKHRTVPSLNTVFRDAFTAFEKANPAARLKDGLGRLTKDGEFYANTEAQSKGGKNSSANEVKADKIKQDAKILSERYSNWWGQPSKARFILSREKELDPRTNLTERKIKRYMQRFPIQ